jgi:hypothetical protein
MQEIMEGLGNHPTIESLEIKSCNSGNVGAIRAIEEFFRSTHEDKLQTLILEESNINPQLFSRILVALQVGKDF